MSGAVSAGASQLSASITCSNSGTPRACAIDVPGQPKPTLIRRTTASRTRALDDGLERLRRAASEASRRPEALCDYVLHACTEGLRRDDDICVLAVRLAD